ncbi:hypothetical protein K4F52_006549 [Lecanicillium sp. MT-2017a]|nr:hypothetical protein K4F52_006549 [Lecanicillium sp. MT-2017a]
MFQSYYEQVLPQSASSISWIGSIQIFLLFFLGTFSGRAADAGFFKFTWTTGALLNLAGIFLTSFCRHFWQLFLAQGLCMGIGCGLMFYPVLSLMTTYFVRHRSLAVGVAATGSATGGLIFPAVFEQLLPRVGFQWTVRILGFTTLAMLLPSFLLLKQRIPPRQSDTYIDWTAFREPAYVFFAIGMFFNFWGLYIAFYYITTFAQQVVNMSRASSLQLLLIMNGVGFLARTVPNFLADWFTGPVNLLIPSTFFSSVMLLCWTSIEQEPQVYTFVVFYGIFSGAVQSLFPATLASFTPDLSKVGVRMGMVLSTVSFAALTGAPIGGVLVSQENGRFLYAQIFAGASMFTGTALVLLARVYKVGLRFRAKA